MNHIELKNINKSFSNNILFERFNLDIAKGELCVIYGKSGCGKTTLLNIMGLLEFCSGDVLINGKKYRSRSFKARDLLKKEIGYLFQNFALIDDETVYENLKIVCNDKNKIEEILKRVDLENISKKYIYQLSGGEQQRVAIARLILKDVSLILADEPTGSLDTTNKQIIMKLLEQLNEDGKTVVIVTHDNDFRVIASKIVEL